MTILLVVISTVLTLAVPSQPALATQTEAADMQQRLRVALESLRRDVSAAGADVGPAMAPLLPYHAGAAFDPPGTFRSDAVTVRYVRTGETALTTVAYALKRDAPAGADQLVVGNGTTPDVPLVDNVVSLRFDYEGEPLPPVLRRPMSDPDGPRTTYGPPPASAPTPPFAAGENCVFVPDAGGAPRPRLPALGPPGTRVLLTPTELTDGPWCPDAGAPERWDADLLRVRTVVVTIRVQAAAAAFRGPAGVLFTHGGVSRGGAAWLPDLEARLRIVPANLDAR